MIEYRLFTKPELLQWRRDHGLDKQSQVDVTSPHRTRETPRIGVQDDPTNGLSLRYSHEVDDDDICGICAFDGDRMIGRLSILYFDLLLDGRRQRCSVGSDFMVLEEYRKRAIGLSILLKAMNLGMPYFEASVSGQMRGIIERMKQFHQVDNSPIFQLGLDRPGILQIATWDFYKKDPTDLNKLSEQLTKFKLLSANWFHFKKLLRLGSSRYELIKVDQALDILATDFSVPRFAVQIPWNRDLLIRGLSGTQEDFGAWLIRFPHDSERCRLISLYRRDRVLGKDAQGGLKILREAHLNEVYPPLGPDDPILPILAFAGRQAKARQASVLHIHALTKAMETTCRDLGLSSHNSKAVFVAPGNLEAEVTSTLTDRAQWWCRAFNESQLHEAVASATNSNSLLP